METSLDWFTWLMRLWQQNCVQFYYVEVSLPLTRKCSSSWGCAFLWLCMLPCVTNGGRDPACVFRETVLVSWWSVSSLHKTEVPVVETRGRDSGNVLGFETQVCQLFLPQEILSWWDIQRLDMSSCFFSSWGPNKMALAWSLNASGHR